MKLFRQYPVVSFDEVVMFLYAFCSGQQKPKSFLEIQQEQESDFTIKGTAQSGGGGGTGVTTPTGNKMKVSPCRSNMILTCALYVKE